jgi:hypothetical protein
MKSAHPSAIARLLRVSTAGAPVESPWPAREATEGYPGLPASPRRPWILGSRFESGLRIAVLFLLGTWAGATLLPRLLHRGAARPPKVESPSVRPEISLEGLGKSALHARGPGDSPPRLVPCANRPIARGLPHSC